MNKAFVKESEDAGDRCPLCGSPGQAVFETTIAAHVPAEFRAELAEPASFCPNANCSVGYFDKFERVVRADQLLAPVYPKDANAPICPCFGVTCEEIEADARSGNVARVREHIQRAQADSSRCVTLSPSGQSCVAAVQRCYLRAANS